LKLEEAKKEYYRRLAREEGYKSRAAYKLLEAVTRYRLIKPGDSVLDLGSAPGGWIQVAAETVGDKGVVIGVDLSPIKLPPQGNVHLFQADINDPAIVENVRALINPPRPLPLDVLLSDLSPNISGVWELDHYKQIELTLRSLAIGDSLLKVGGNAMLKVFDGERFAEIRKEADRRFQVVHIMKPKASRRESSEMYLLCLTRRRP
jgi:23S rRNA (uridine2552-2'-O)-methyltransferase